MKGEIILDVEKEFGDKMIPAGTCLGEVNTLGKFTIEDLDIAVQLGEARITTKVEGTKEKSK